jgi:hypothetical protein
MCSGSGLVKPVHRGQIHQPQEAQPVKTAPKLSGQENRT